MEDKSVAIILYANVDHYPSTIDAIRLLENEYKIIVFSRNTDGQFESFGKNTILYKFGRYASIKKSEKKSGLSKLCEYIIFTLKTAYCSGKHKCRSIIAYDSYSLTTAIILRLFNPQIKVFHHAHEIIEPGISKWYHLRYWTEKVTLRCAKDCLWVSQPDIKRAQFFEKMTGIKNVKVMKNFALYDFKYPGEKLVLCEKLKKDGYTVCAFTGTISKKSYIKYLLDFVKTSEIKIAIIISGDVRDEATEYILKHYKKDYNDDRHLSKLIYLGFLLKEKMYALLNSADFALVLYTPSFMAEMNAGSSAKIGTYLIFGLPVIYPSFWDYEPHYKKIGLNYRDGEELKERITQMAKDRDLRRKLSENAKELFRESINFESEFRGLKKTIDHYMRMG